MKRILKNAFNAISIISCYKLNNGEYVPSMDDEIMFYRGTDGVHDVELVGIKDSSTQSSFVNGDGDLVITCQIHNGRFRLFYSRPRLVLSFLLV